MGVTSDHEDGDHNETRDSRHGSPGSDHSGEVVQKIVRYHSRSRSHDRSASGSPSDHKSKKKSSRSRSRSRSHHRSRKSKYRSRSRSPRKHSRSSRHSRSRSYSRSRSGSESPYRRRGRSGSRSPMTSRRRNTASRTSLQDNPRPNRCLGVFGLNLKTTETQLYQIFSKYGRVDRVQVIMDAKTGRSRGFCFVYYEHMEDARNAREQCSNMEVDGRNIRVDYSITERAHTPTPGIYMGKPSYDDRYSRRRSERYDDDYYGGGYRGRYRSPSPYYSRSSRRSRYDRSRSRSYSPRRY